MLKKHLLKLNREVSPIIKIPINKRRKWGVQSNNYLQLSDVPAYVLDVFITLFIFLTVAYFPLNIFTLGK